MRKNILGFILISFLAFIPEAKSHDLHYQDAKTKIWQTPSGSLFGSFYLLKNNIVFIEDTSGNIIKTPLKTLSKQDQKWVLKKHDFIQKINHIKSTKYDRTQNATTKANVDLVKQLDVFYVVILLIIIFLMIRFIPQLRPLKFTQPILVGILLLTLSSFTMKILKITGMSTRISFLDSAFAFYKPGISTRSDNNYYYVESLGLPDHEMMLGITTWQQQVPIPQCYVGSNAWSIPINPIIAATPVPVNQNHFLRGAVALAVNGIPIFNPYTNTGLDAFLDGQLDQYGGHCGRADDYHYHIAPKILYNTIPKTSPVAFALDGFSVYGDYEPDGTPQKILDANHGHYGSDGTYHYHGSDKAPYMIGNMVGTVTEDATMQIIPQAAAKGVRPALTPLKGASITHCHPYPTGNGFKLTYTLGTDKDTVDYTWTNNGDYTYKFITPAATNTNNYKGQAPCKLTVENHSLPKGTFYAFSDDNNQIHLICNQCNIKPSHVRIFNAIGTLVHQQNIINSTTTISTIGWSAGGYFLLITDTHRNSTTIKIML